MDTQGDMFHDYGRVHYVKRACYLRCIKTLRQRELASDADRLMYHDWEPDLSCICTDHPNGFGYAPLERVRVNAQLCYRMHPV